MSDESTFQIVNFSADLLGSYYTAKQQATSLLTLPSVPSNVSLGGTNNALTPWDQDRAIQRERLADNPTSTALYRLLSSDYASIQNKEEFIDRRNSLVRDADLDIDSKGLFTLYNALRDLKTIADFAGDPRTSDNKTAALEAQFQLGFSQVKDFIRTEAFDDLTLLYGQKLNGVTARAGLGRKEADYIGPIIHEGKIDDPLSKLSGGEEFTISITKSKIVSGVSTKTTEDFVITIPADDDQRTLDAVISQINSKIQTTKTTNNDGDEIPLFNTRVFAEEVSSDKFALRIKSDFTEDLSFLAADTEPAIYITGNSNPIDLATKQLTNEYETTSFVTKLTNLDDVSADREFHLELYGSGGDALLTPDKTASSISVNPLENAAKTTTNAITTDSKGNFFTVGATDGRFANHINTSETGDAFLNKYDAGGKLLWSRLVGSQGDASTYAITIDADDNIIVAGQADKLTAGESNDPLATSDNVFDGQDSFVVKYDNVGTQQWMYLNDQYGTDGASSITTDADGHVYLTGRKNSLELSTTVVSGNDNAYVIKLDGANGSLSDTVEIGSSSADLGQGIAVAADGNIVLATHEDGNFILQKLDKDDLSNSLWSYDYGDMGDGSEINQVVVDGSRIYVSGSSNNSLTGGGIEIGAPLGGLDNFVLALDDAGNGASADWTKFIGSDQADKNGGIIVSGGKIYLSGTTSGSVDGGVSQGSTDSFASKIDALTGVTDWTKQLGFATENREATGIAFATLGTSVLTKLGLPIGQFEDDQKRVIASQTTARAGDYFFIKVNDRITKKIEIKQGDTYRTLANRINRASFRYVNASVSFSSGTTNSVEKEEEVKFDAKAIIAEKLKQIQNERNGVEEEEEFSRADRATTGNTLKIGSKEGGRIEIIAGRGEKDALKKLGLEPSLILSTQELFDLDQEDDDDIQSKIGGVFAFKLDDRFSVSDKRDARFVARELESALGIVQSAYRSLTFDPLAEQIKRDALRKTDGPVPPALQKQLANYQDGLRRISSLVPQGGVVI